ncbi:MAG: hypothetical protein KGI45_03620 [Patescibacteria group bacterium]|nr:hypothetical protein [Patescibacteria group bacterium]
MNESDYRNFLGYVKYEGESVREGFFDARKAAEALSGLDQSLRYFINKKGITADFEIPVRIEKGSWIALIPQTFLGWTEVGAGVIVTAYLATAAKEIAKNDFKNVDMKSLISTAIKSIQSVIRISKHLGIKIKSEIKNISWDDQGGFICLKNEGGSMLKVTKDELDLYTECPQNLLQSFASLVEDDRTFKIGLVENGKIQEQEINNSDKELFWEGDTPPADELFPELRDGDVIELKGKITKGNQRTNYIGLEYKDHILNCRPEKWCSPFSSYTNLVS